MTLEELRRKLSAQQTDAERYGATAPVACVLKAVLEDLASLGTTEPSDALSSAVDLTVSQVARRIGLAASTVRQMCNRGDFAGAYVPSGGKLWRVPVASVLAWQDAQRARAGRGEDLGDWRDAS